MSKNNSYIFGFLDTNGEIYDYYISDNLDDGSTWNAIDFKFSLPHSKFMVIWRNDGKNISKEESDHLTKYVRDDMNEFMREPLMSDSSIKQGEAGTQTVIRKKLLSSKNYLILAYDTMELPFFIEDWQELADITHDEVLERLEEPQYEHLPEQAVLDVLDGKFPTNPYFENYKFRDTQYPGFDLPSDNVLKTIFQKIKNKEFHNAAEFLSGFYNISPPTVDLDTKLPENTFVFYDNLESKIMLSLERLSDFELQLPAFFLGFFKHLSLSKNWKFDVPVDQAHIVEKKEAEKFSQMLINRLLELNLDPRRN